MAFSFISARVTSVGWMKYGNFGMVTGNFSTVTGSKSLALWEVRGPNKEVYSAKNGFNESTYDAVSSIAKSIEWSANAGLETRPDGR